MRLKASLLISSLLTAAALTLVGCGSSATVASPSSEASPSSDASPSASSSPAPTAHPSVKASTSLDSISVTGDFGKDPAISFKAPFAIDKTRSKVLISGDGPEVAASNYVRINYHGVNGYTAKTFDNSWTKGEPALMSLSSVVAGFQKGLTGKHVGDRVLVAIPGKDGYDSSGGSGDGSILVGDTLVFVIDILDINYAEPYGTAEAQKAGLPTVSNPTKGVPSVKINSSATPPTETVVQPLVKGKGDYAIAAGDDIMVRYREYSWQTGKLLTDKYSGDPDVGSLNDTVTCWKDGLVGQKLGSRLMLVCPPATGYPYGNPTPSIAKGDTVVFVIDLILAAPSA